MVICSHICANLDQASQAAQAGRDSHPRSKPSKAACQKQKNKVSNYFPCFSKRSEHPFGPSLSFLLTPNLNKKASKALKHMRLFEYVETIKADSRGMSFHTFSGFPYRLQLQSGGASQEAQIRESNLSDHLPVYVRKETSPKLKNHISGSCPDGNKKGGFSSACRTSKRYLFENVSGRS